MIWRRNLARDLALLWSNCFCTLKTTQEQLRVAAADGVVRGSWECRQGGQMHAHCYLSHVSLGLSGPLPWVPGCSPPTSCTRSGKWDLTPSWERTPTLLLTRQQSPQCFAKLEELVLHELLYYFLASAKQHRHWNEQTFLLPESFQVHKCWTVFLQKIVK